MTIYYTSPIEQVTIQGNPDHVIEVILCPCCCGFFGVDWTFLDQQGNEVTCPMCEETVNISEV